MTYNIRKYWLIAVGLVMIIAGIVASMIGTNNSDVPNDPNIGAGVLFVFGVVTLAGGLIAAWSMRAAAR